MASLLQDPLDVGQLAAQRTQLDREFLIDDFDRVRSSLARPQGQAVAHFRFHVAGNYPALEGAVRAKAWLVCQRCLQEFEATVESPVRVAFVTRDAEASRVPDEYDAVTAPDGRVALLDFVEDELLLALPLVPMHPTTDECTGRRPPAVAEPLRVVSNSGVTKPFAGLGDLFKR